MRSLPGRLEAMDWGAINSVLAEMERAGTRVLRRTVPADQITFRRFGDLCYRRQGYEIRVPVPAGELGLHRQGAIHATFEQAYGAIYGHVLPDLEIDVVSWRVVAEGPRPALRAPAADAGGRRSEALKGRRKAYLLELVGMPAANQGPAVTRMRSTGLSHSAGGAGTSTSSIRKSPLGAIATRRQDPC